ncbi:MAG: CHAD domain-containing protein [Melioribacteraceae bacterium]|jgi:CHAD domain-containing protein|nr:CHAD domain-containing protein [Melioribacteraceae bacterium]
MSIEKKFKIPGLNINSKYKTASNFVLNEKLKQIFKEIDKFFDDDSSENLHSLRIAFRRLRYVMEIFQECMNPELFKYIYKLSKKMQDLIGEGRDLDVMEIKVRQMEKEINKKIPDYFYKRISEDRRIVRQTIKTELINFIIDKDINSLFIK